MPIGNHYTSSLALGDVDGDGDLDLIVGNVGDVYSGTPSRLYTNDGNGAFTDVSASRMPAGNHYTSDLALGDLDGDRDLDLVLGNSDQCLLYRNDGTGTYTDATAMSMPAGSYGTRSLALGDVDGDGDLDLVLGNSKQSRLYSNDGTGTFTDLTVTRLPLGYYLTTSLELGDVDHDGDLDLVLGNLGAGFSGAQSRLYSNDGTGTFTDATAARMPIGNHYTSSLALGDVDGDGDLDLLLGNTGDFGAQSLLYLNDGSGTFTDATAARVPAGRHSTAALALGDVDRDGDLDLVLGNSGSFGGQSCLYVNLRRQLDAPFALHVGRAYRLDVYARYGPARAVDTALPFLASGTADLALPPFGRVGLDPRTIVVLPPFLVSQPAGVSSLSIAVPADPALAGQAHRSGCAARPAPTAPDDDLPAAG